MPRAFILPFLFCYAFLLAVAEDRDVENRPDSGAKIAGELKSAEKLCSIKPEKKDRIAGFSTRPNTYEAGGIFGYWLLAGEANFMECNYRCAVRFDLSPFIPEGKVRRASLKTSQTHFGYRAETAILEILTEEWPGITPNVLLSNRAEKIAEYTLPAGTKNKTLIFDVTAFVNARLRNGTGSAVFRFVSRTAAEQGNTEAKACGITIHENLIELLIESETQHAAIR